MTLIGDVERVSTDPPFKNSLGVATDPSTITLRWSVDGGADTVWVYGTDSQLQRDGTGTYHADIPCLLAGTYLFRWTGTGTVEAVNEGSFIVSEFQSGSSRSSMAVLITRVRRLVGDPAGAGQFFGDSDVQVALDERRTRVIEAQLRYEYPFGVGSGQATDFYAPRPWWEDNVVLHNTSGAVLTPDSVDLVTGRWTFSAGQAVPVYITGWFYDVYGSAMTLANEWAAALARDFDFGSDGQMINRSQKSTALLAQAAELARRAVAPGVRPAWRSSEW